MHDRIISLENYDITSTLTIYKLSGSTVGGIISGGLLVGGCTSLGNVIEKKRKQFEENRTIYKILFIKKNKTNRFQEMN